MRKPKLHEEYLVMAALRGPDYYDHPGAVTWKHFVVAPLRWMMAKSLKADPDEWCSGSSGSILARSKTLTSDQIGTAQEFVATAWHVVDHAKAAWEIAAKHSDEAKQYYKKLKKHKLL